MSGYVYDSEGNKTGYRDKDGYEYPDKETARYWEAFSAKIDPLMETGSESDEHSEFEESDQ